MVGQAPVGIGRNGIAKLLHGEPLPVLWSPGNVSKSSTSVAAVSRHFHSHLLEILLVLPIWIFVVSVLEGIVTETELGFVFLEVRDEIIDIPEMVIELIFQEILINLIIPSIKGVVVVVLTSEIAILQVVLREKGTVPNLEKDL